MNQIDLDAVIRSVEDQPNDRGEMSNEAMSSKVLDIASCGVETTEGDPIRFNALARDMQQPALASQRSCASLRPNICRSVKSPRVFLFYGPSAYRVGTPPLSRARLRGVRCRKLESCVPRSGVHAPARVCLHKQISVRGEVCILTLSYGWTDMQAVQTRERYTGRVYRATHRQIHHKHTQDAGAQLGPLAYGSSCKKQNDTKQVRMVAELLVSDRSSC